MKVWTLTSHWIENSGECMDCILLNIYSTYDLANAAMDKEAEPVKDKKGFQRSKYGMSIDLGGRHYWWEIEEREVQNHVSNS